MQKDTIGVFSMCARGAPLYVDLVHVAKPALCQRMGRNSRPNFGSEA